MPSITTYTAAGAKSSAKVNLDKEIFGLEVTNHNLLKSAYEAYLANGRVNLAKSKTRGEVSGSTKKPWRQKGTGRARFGSRYNPIWRGGGIVFGPTGNENYKKKLTLNSKRVAIKQALSLAVKSDQVKIIDSFDVKDAKTKTAAKLLDKLGANGRILIAVDQKSDGATRATNNLENVRLIQFTYLNAHDILDADTILISKNVLDDLSTWLNAKTKTVKPAETKAKEASK